MKVTAMPRKTNFTANGNDYYRTTLTVGKDADGEPVCKLAAYFLINTSDHNKRRAGGHYCLAYAPENAFSVAYGKYCHPHGGKISLKTQTQKGILIPHSQKI